MPEEGRVGPASDESWWKGPRQGPFHTERAGFEPATQLSPRTRFPVALLRPLGHLSESETLASASRAQARLGRARRGVTVAWHVDAVRSLQELPTGAEARFSGRGGPLAVVCANGGQSAEVPGTWSASIEWLVGRLAPLFPGLRFAELRYRVKSWRRLDLCVEDAVAAIEATGARAGAPDGLLDGRCRRRPGRGTPGCDGCPRPGAVAAGPARPRSPPGRRLDVLHGALDRWLPGIPGVSPASSRRGYERARRLGVDGSYTVIPRAVHGVALRSPWVPLWRCPAPGAGPSSRRPRSDAFGPRRSTTAGNVTFPDTAQARRLAACWSMRRRIAHVRAADASCRVVLGEAPRTQAASRSRRA